MFILPLSPAPQNLPLPRHRLGFARPAQGAVLATSDRGGVRIQYSKNPFGKKRDAAGNWISTHEPPPQHAQQPQQAQQAAYVYGGAPYSPGGPAGMAVSPSPGAAAPDSGAYSGMQQQQQFAPAPGVDAAGAPGSYGDGMQQAGGAPQAQGQPAYALQPGAKQEEAGTQQGFGAPPGAQAGGEGADAMANGGLPGLGAAEEPGGTSSHASLLWEIRQGRSTTCHIMSQRSWQGSSSRTEE